jgi:hypothetical protein
MIYDFNTQLEKTQEPEFLKLRFKFYENWFGPNLASIEKGILTEDKIGIDWKCNMKSGRSKLIDEKLTTSYDAFWLEEFSDIYCSEKLSWLTKENYVTDYLAYWIGQNRCYMFDYLTVQLAWFKNCKDWKQNHKKLNIQRKEIENSNLSGSWTTLVWLVPVDVFLKAYQNIIFTGAIKKKLEMEQK